jgi:hypothetical protein
LPHENVRTYLLAAPQVLTGAAAASDTLFLPYPKRG